MELCKDFFSYRLLDEEKLITLIKRERTPVKSGTRKFVRNVNNRSYSNQHRVC